MQGSETSSPSSDKEKAVRDPLDGEDQHSNSDSCRQTTGSRRTLGEDDQSTTRKVSEVRNKIIWYLLSSLSFKNCHRRGLCGTA